jgi:2'-5' RNA ligase
MIDGCIDIVWNGSPSLDGDMNPMRCFVAFDLPAELRARLADVLAGLDSVTPEGAVRWVRPQSIHLTLKFLGEITPDAIPGLVGALQSAAERSQPFTFSVGGLGCFPNPARARVVWIGIREDSGAMHKLYEDVETSLAGLGFRREDRPFSPHLTLGRVRREAGTGAARRVGEAVQRVPAPALGEVSTGPLILFRSDLRPTGAVYTRVATFSLEERR